MPDENRTKVKVRKWIDTGDLKRYEKYICDWHYFIKELQNRCMTGEEGYMKKVSMTVLQVFYLTPYDGNLDFYEQFYDRMNVCQRELAI